VNEKRSIGLASPRVEGEQKVNGSAIYAEDVALPEMLWAKVLRSPIAHARITKIDITRAAKLPGVKAVITGADLAGAKIGKKIVDMPVIAETVVRYIGEKVAAVAAESEAVAEAALDLIDVDYEELPVVTDPLKAAEVDAPLLHPDLAEYKGLLHKIESPSNVFVHLKWKKGEVEEGFRQSDEIIENTFTVPAVHQAYIEPHASLVRLRADGGAEIWSSNKSPFALREQLGNALQVPPASLIIHPCYVGGDFGGKGDGNDVAACYALARASGRPVKLVLDYSEELIAGNPRHGAVIKIKTGIKKNGILIAQHVEFIFDSGAYGAYRPQGFLVGAHDAPGPYRVPNCLVEEKYVYTNKMPCGYMRAPGHLQAMFACESQADLVARHLRMDPVEFRRLNLMHDGDTAPLGEVIAHVKATETLMKAVDASGYGRPKETQRGRGCAIADWVSKGGESYAFIKIDTDGVVTLSSAVTDTGPGVFTMMRQIVAEELKVSIDSVQVQMLDSSEVIKDTGVRGSSSTRVHGSSALDAAQKAREEVLQVAARAMNAAPEELILYDGGVTHRRAERRMTYAEIIRANGGELVTEGHYLNMADGPEASLVAQVAEVEVDQETGEVRVQELITAHNTGRILNPLTHQGQIDGAVVMGLGYGVIENLAYDESGKVLAANLGEYKIPNVKDIPALRTTILQSDFGSGPYNSMSIGETALIPTAAAIANAIEDAVGVRIKSLPITAEKVLTALKTR
jgi:carbon-monoxide dehydrogenase large subunit